MVYLDDIFIYSKSKEEHEFHVRKVLQRLRDEQLIANLKKCDFFKTELEFLGFHISAGGYLPSREKVKAIQEWPVPTNVHEVRQFIGLGSHYRRFIRDFASIASPLTDLTKGSGTKTRPIEWSDECQKAFEEIKSRITQAPFWCHLILTNHSSLKRMHPIMALVQCSYKKMMTALLILWRSNQRSSQTRNDRIRHKKGNYWLSFMCCVHGGVLWMVELIRYSDHDPLTYFRSQKKPTLRLTRWIGEIELYSPDIRYKPGKENRIPDLLSRRDGPSCEPNETSMEPEYLYVVKSVQDSDWPKLYARSEDQWPTILKDLLIQHKDKFVTKNNQVYRLVKNGDTFEERRYVLYAKRADLVHDFHHSVGHAAKTTVTDLMAKRWWWPHMTRDIQEWLATCPKCQLAANADRKTHHAPMIPLDIPPPFSRWHLDFVGELPTTARGNKWLLVAVDYTTSWCCACALPAATGEAIADFIYKELVLRFGCMNEILTDRGANFMLHVLANYLGRMKVNHKFTSAFHPRTNGIIKQMIRNPFYLTYGQEPRLPGDELPPFLQASVNDTESPELLVKGLVPAVRELRKARLLAQHKLNNNARQDKQRWDAAMKPQIFNVGDHVLLRHENKFSLEYNWKGPNRILARNLDTHVYQLQDMNNSTYTSWVHTDRLRPIHLPNNAPPTQPWYDPTSCRANMRQQLSFLNSRNDLFEDDQKAGEGILSWHLPRDLGTPSTT